MFFYKYNQVSPLSLMMLKRGEVYFASAIELNDKHECRAQYVFNGTKDVWIRFIDYILVELVVNYGIYSSSIEETKKFFSLASLIYEILVKNDKRKNYDFEFLLDALPKSIIKACATELDVQHEKEILKFIPELFASILKDDLREQKYIASFSLNAVNPTMWGHYANAESGFLVIYESEKGNVEVKSTLNNLSGYRKKSGITEIGRYNNEILPLKKVKYSKIPCKINGFYQLIHKFRYSEMEAHYDVPESFYGEIRKIQEDLVGLVKYTDWKYENEVRLLFPTFERLPSALRCLEVSRKHIRGVIFGSSTSDSDKRKIVMACYHLNQTGKSKNDFVFLQAVDSHKDYKMKIEPFGVLNDICFGEVIPIDEYDALEDKKKNMLMDLCIEISKGS
ncbi:DUF2971 domain-containing protein [Marinobacterium sp. D7]|uniref:DUF2971 domain-containing protein n=1 Tax=Marinobacterium ramblicola TaxID=2849041 RepID=UPI001C2DEA26|nr:DUF2971 domain-containing protein [Marinobacterium ramblicola]MBV1790535.1 DUF2971 domain-containing protein [Marinobacterium ramblicola]